MLGVPLTHGASALDRIKHGGSEIVVGRAGSRAGGTHRDFEHSSSRVFHGDSDCADSKSDDNDYQWARHGDARARLTLLLGGVQVASPGGRLTLELSAPNGVAMTGPIIGHGGSSYAKVDTHWLGTLLFELDGRAVTER
jgi:hypothetical protein